MANLNQAPRAGETDDDDSTESSDLKPAFFEAAFGADKRAKEREAAQQKALQEENQRRILEFLNLSSEDDEEDEEDSKTSKQSKSKTDTSQKVTPTPAVNEQSQEQPHAEGELKVDHAAEVEIEEFDMSSEEAPEEPEIPLSTTGVTTEDQPDVPDIQPAVAAAKVESAYDQDWIPNQGETAANLDPDSKAEVFEQTAIDEEPAVSEAPPRPEVGMDTPPPPPEEPPTANYDSFDTPPPPPDPEVEAESDRPPEEPPQEQVVETRREVIDRHSGGVGAALMAFFAANWLSRRRDRKIRREAQKLEKNFQKSQEEAEAERRHNRQAQRQAESLRQEQAAKLSRLERAQAHPPEVSQAEAKGSAEVKEGPVPLAEVLAATAYAKVEEKPSPNKTDSKENNKEKPAGPASSRFTRAEKVDEKPATAAEASPDAGREANHEISKEAKTDRQARIVDSGRGRVESGSALDAAEASLSRRDEESDSIYKMSMDENTDTSEGDLYRKSIATGAAVGVAVVVLIAAVYLLF